MRFGKFASLGGLAQVTMRDGMLSEVHIDLME
jgi:hypothetical protein